MSEEYKHLKVTDERYYSVTLFEMVKYHKKCINTLIQTYNVKMNFAFDDKLKNKSDISLDEITNLSKTSDLDITELLQNHFSKLIEIYDKVIETGRIESSFWSAYYQPDL